MPSSTAAVSAAQTSPAAPRAFLPRRAGMYTSARDSSERRSSTTTQARVPWGDAAGQHGWQAPAAQRRPCAHCKILPALTQALHLRSMRPLDMELGVCTQNNRMTATVPSTGLKIVTNTATSTLQAAGSRCGCCRCRPSCCADSDCLNLGMKGIATVLIAQGG